MAPFFLFILADMETNSIWPADTYCYSRENRSSLAALKIEQRLILDKGKQSSQKVYLIQYIDELLFMAVLHEMSERCMIHD